VARTIARYAYFMFCCAGVLALAAACRPVQPAATGAPFTVTLAKANDRAQVGGDAEYVTVDIFSATGIGSATLRWSVDQVPPALQLKLHLTGLEALRLHDGATDVVAAVASRPPYPVTATAGDGTALAPGDALWPTIEIVAAGGQAAAIPLQDGYFRVEVPTALLTGDAHALQVSWIDFYR
jgi:hypothetical protein